MRRFTVLDSSATLDSAVEALLNSQETEFVIVEGDAPKGILTRNEIIKGLSERGKDAPVSAFMNPDFFIVGSEMKLEDFLQKVLEKGQNVAFVIDGDSLRGLIDRENVEEKLLIQEALKTRRENT